MAKIGSGVTLAADFIIREAPSDRYPFSFAVGAETDILVEVNGVAVSPRKYAVVINVAGTGGHIRFLGASEATDPVELSDGDTVRIQRDTLVARAVRFGRSGFAQSATAEAESSHQHRILEELAARLIAHADIHLSAAEIGALVISNIASGAVDFNQLATDVRTAIDDKVESGSMRFLPDIRSLQWVDGHGNQGSTDIPTDASAPTRSQIYTLIKAILTEGVDIDLTPDDDLMRLAIAAVGGGMREGFLRRQEPTGVRTAMTLAGSTAGGYGPWTNIATLSAITNDEAGEVILTGEIHGVATDGSGGGTRVLSEARIVRTRGADVTYPSDMKVYGPRRLGSSSSSTSTEFAAASTEVSWELVALDSAQEGDVYTTQVRVQQQPTSGAAVPVTFQADSTNKLSIASLGGPRGAKGDKGDDGSDGDSAKLTALSAVPSITGYTEDDVINVDGVLYKLVPDDTEGSTLRGTAERRTPTSMYIGVTHGIPTLNAKGSFADPAYDGEVVWRAVESDSLPFWIVKLDENVFTGLPATIYGIFVDQRGETADMVLNRNVADDQTGFANYQSAADVASVDTPSGDTFRVTFYTDAAHTTELKVHLTDRWELVSAMGKPSSAPSSVTTANVYERAKLIVKAGARTSIVFDDNANTITINGKGIPTGTTLPVDPQVGDDFILLSDEDIAVDPVLTTYQAQTTLRQVALNGGPGRPEALRGYSTGYSGPNAATRRGRVFLVYNGARTKTAVRQWYYGEGKTPRSFQVEGAIRAGLPNEYVVTGLDYGTFAVGDHHTNTEYDDGTKLNPDQRQQQGHLRYRGGAQGWTFAEGVAAWWAVQGQPRPGERLAVTELDQGNTTPGLSIVNSSANARTGLHGFAQAFDLDDDDKLHGVLNVEATVAVSLASNTGIGFDSDSTNPLTSIRITAFAFANKLRAQAAYLDGITDAVHGTLMGTVVVRLGGDTLGTARVYIAHDGSNVVGLGLVYTGSSGAETFSLTVQDISAVFEHNDGPGAAPLPNAQGRLIGRTTALPETTVANGTQLAVSKARTDGRTGFTGDYGWLQDSISSEVRADGYSGFGPNSATSGEAGIWPGAAGRNIELILPGNAPGQRVIGLQYRTKLGNTHVQTANVLWGPGSLTRESPTGSDVVATVLFFRGGTFSGNTGDAARVVANYQVSQAGYPTIQLLGDGTALPAGCTVELYELQV